jgi:hypothetical protein
VTLTVSVSARHALNSKAFQRVTLNMKHP